MIKLDKKGAIGNQLHIFPFMFLLLVIAGSVVIGYSMYLGNGYDTRLSASQELHLKIEKCINENEINSDLLSKCGIDLKVMEDNGFIVRICNDKCTSGQNPIVFVGSNYQGCDINSNDKSYPKCTKSNFTKSGNNYELITGSVMFPRRNG